MSNKLQRSLISPKMTWMKRLNS